MRKKIAPKILIDTIFFVLIAACAEGEQRAGGNEAQGGVRKAPAPGRSRAAPARTSGATPARKWGRAGE
jgi:hypothetical protein